MRTHPGWRRHRKLFILATSALLMLTAWLLAHESGPGSTGRGLAEVVQPWLLPAAAIVAGVPVVQQAWGSLRLRQFSIPLLVTLAATGAVMIGEAWEAAAVTFLYVFGGYLEDLTLARTRAALRSLIELRPRTARLRDGDGWREIPAEAVKAGETVIVLPGDQIPVDGRVVAGHAALDTATLTGEPLPVEAGPGDRVLSGYVSQSGQLEIAAEQVGADTTFQRLIFLVAKAQEQKPKVARLLDRFARWYTPAVMAAAVVLGLATRDARLALTFLVIGCPGALVVAAPVANVAGLGRAARDGMLIKGGERLERVGQIDAVAFDKTGTLTHGRPAVRAVIPFDGRSEAAVLAWAAAAEQRSEHHLASAILRHAADAGIEPVPAHDWQLEPGLGATAATAAGLVLVGNRRLLSAHGVALSPAHEAAIAERESQGETVAIVAVAGEAVGVVAISDEIRPAARLLAPALRRAGIRHTVMLTGDNRAAAQRIADTLGLDACEADLSPEDKVRAIRRLQAAGHTVAMVGDGINDAPALAAADVAMAMGGAGTAAAMEVADITLMGDRLEQVPAAIALSRRITAVVRQNVAFAVATVLLLLAGVVSRHIHLAGGMLIHEASILLVILNGMRLLSRRRAGAAGALAQQRRPEPVRAVGG